MKKWIKIAENKYVAEGKIGKDYVCENAHEISLIHNYNGSSLESFGGVKEWPVVKIEISFQEGKESEAINYLNKIMNLL